MICIGIIVNLANLSVLGNSIVIYECRLAAFRASDCTQRLVYRLVNDSVGGNRTVEQRTAEADLIGQL